MKRKSGTVLTALFAALICAGCFIQIPLAGGIPIILNDMLALLSGLILGPVYGGAAVLIFLILGSVGFPVFSGAAGIAVILEGPTGGFLAGFLLGSITGGLIMGNKPATWLRTSIASIVSMIVLFIAGALRFAMLFPDKNVWTFAVLPFIPGTIIKLAVMIPVTRKFRAVIARYNS